MKKTFFLLALCCLLLFGACSSSQTLPELSVTFFDLGKADSILIRTPQSAVLIDAGTNKNGEELASSLSALGLSSLDALIITHFDKDHVGGADQILRAFAPPVVLQPGYEKESKQMTQYLQALEDLSLHPVTLQENTHFSLDGVSYFIDTANAAFYGEDEENDFSLVIRAEYGNTSFLFAGDAEKKRLNELLQEGNLKADVLKVPHHGVYEDNSPLFFSAVSPQYAVITSSEKDPEDRLTLQALNVAGCKTYLTRQGEIQITSDGETLRIRQ